MSKNFNKSRKTLAIAPDKGAEDKHLRPSVFERLGVRSGRDNSNSSFSQSDNYGSSRRSDSMKPAHHHGGRDSRPRVLDGSGKRRSRSPASYSPSAKNLVHSRKYDDPNSTNPYAVKPSKYKDMNNSVPDVGRPNSSKKAMKDSPAKHKMSKSDSKHQVNKKEKDKKRAFGAKKSDKKKKKGKSSSDSSDDSYSSSSSKSSSSSSSSSSNNSSSSESSVPSVKLKAEKPKAKKKKKGKIIEKRPIPPVASSSSRSSSSGVEANLHPSVGTKRGGIDLREKLNARSPQSLKEAHQQYHPKDSRMDLQKRMTKPYEREPRPPLLPLPDEDRHGPKKRAVPQDPYMPEDVKRRRMLSPPPSDKYRQPMDNPHHRRAPPQMHDPPKRGRTPPPTGFQKDPHFQRVTNSPMRRPRIDDTRRPDRPLPDRPGPDFRNEIDKRNMHFNPAMKPREREFERYKEPEFGRDGNRPRERVAPSRPPLLDGRHERDRNHPPDYQRRPRGPPFMGPGPDSNRGDVGGFRPQNMDRDRPRFGGPIRPLPAPAFGEKRVPLLPKSKEALAEQYSEQMKKSGYVDKWVNDTVKAVQVQRKVELEPFRPTILPPMSTPTPTIIPTPRPRLSPSPSPSKALESIPVEKPKTEDIEKIELPVPDKGIVEAEDLSDFSDDADEILNNDNEDLAIASETPSASEVEESQKKELIIEKSPSTPLIPPVHSRSGSVEKAASVVSQERLSAKVYPAEGRSLPSQSQTDDDILERMDFEEISEDELGEVENKVHIVDALGVDWASLVCQEKKSEPKAAMSNAASSARKRWNSVNLLASMGVSKALAGEKLYNKIVESKKANDSESSEKDLSQSQQSRISRRQIDILERVGLGPNSRALSSRRDMAVRRYFLDLPQKSLLSMDLLHQSSSNMPPQEMDSVGELYKLSIAMFKPIEEAAT